MATPNPPQDPRIQNMNARMMLLNTGIAMTKKLQPVIANMGENIQIPLQRMGIMTGVTLLFTCSPTWGAANVNAPDAAEVSLCAPFNLAKTVEYQDFAGVKRTRTAGYQLWAAQALKAATMSGSANTKRDFVVPQDSNILNDGVAGGAGTPIVFSLYVPMAYDPSSDLTGAVLTQTNVGEHFINVQLPTSLVGADPWVFPFSGGTPDVGTDAVTVEAFQHYIQPQMMSAATLPMIDLSTIYGFEGAYQTTANIAAGQDTFINYPNNRSILGTLITYENGGDFTPDQTDIRDITLLVNSNTNFRELTPRLLRGQMRDMLGADLASSTYYIASRRQPILTQLYANVQAKMGVLTADAGVTQFITQYEVQYPSGSPLPGITG